MVFGVPVCVSARCYRVMFGFCPYFGWVLSCDVRCFCLCIGWILSCDIQCSCLCIGLMLSGGVPVCVLARCNHVNLMVHFLPNSSSSFD